MEEKIDQKNTKATVLKVLKIVGNIIFYLIVLVILLFSIANIRGKNARDKYPNIFGYGFLTVESNSMDGSQKDSFKKGDLIIVKTPSKKYQPKVGDIVTFVDANLINDASFNKGLNTHRIVYISEDGRIYTQGDYAAENVYKFDASTTESFSQSLLNADYQEFNQSDIVGVYSGNWSGAGNFFSNMSKPTYFGVFVCIPVLIFLAFEIFKVYKNIKALKGVGQEEQAVLDKETLKNQLREELLAQLRAEAEEKHNSESKESLGENSSSKDVEEDKDLKK